MATPIIPPIGTKGRYDLIAPFSTTPGVVYTCAATRYFTDLENMGEDVYELCYKPFNLPESKYTSDRAAGHVIVTLQSEELAPLYVPSSYIARYPDLNAVPYHYVVVSLPLGPLATTVDLTALQLALAATASDTIGIEPEVHIGVMTLSKLFTPQEHEIFETARDAKITNRDTEYGKRLEAERKLQVATQQNAILTQILRDKGLIP